jgi:type II secretory pathway pseudopilin PulG
MSANSKKARPQRGFTIIQMVITIAIIAIVTTFGVLGIRNARAEYNHQNAARLFASYVEKARQDAIRRHAMPGDESSVESFDPGTGTYAVSMDFGSGSVETRNFSLGSGLSFDTAPKKVSFDWRGRITEAWVFQIKSEYLKKNLPVDVSGSGDITVGEQHFPDQTIPAVEISQVTGDVDSDSTPTPASTPAIEGSPSPEGSPTPSPTDSATPTPLPTATPNGNGNGNGSDGNNGNGNSTPTPTPTPAASPSATPIPQCVSTVSPSTLSLSQSDATKQTGNATFTMVNATGVRTISATQAGNGNSLVIGVSLVRIDGNGSSIITVTTKHGAGNRGVFLIDVAGSPSCGSSAQLTVSVSN